MLADVVAAGGLLLLVTSEARGGSPASVIVAIALAAVGLVVGVGLRFFVGREPQSSPLPRRISRTGR